MYNGGPPWNQPSWSHTYYHQYMQQHTQLTQWLQQVHQSATSPHHCAHHCCTTPQNSGHNCGMPQNCQHHCATRNNCCASHAPPVNMGHALPVNMGHARPLNMGHAYPSPQYYPAVETSGVGYLSHEPTVEHVYGEERTEELEVLGGNEDSEESDVGDEDSEGELVFNVDAILAMRATREISDRGSEDSFELLDSVTDDMQEFIQMDGYGNVERVCGRLGEVNAREEELNNKGQLQLLYGEKAASIGGMEALMTVHFDHLQDTLQPALWPVLPLLL